MAFRKVGGGERNYVKYSECSEGDVLAEGIFRGTEAGRYGDQHLFELEDGNTTVLNSAGQLNFLIDKHLVPGMLCRVTYAGKVTIAKGPMAGKESHQFELEVDDSAAPEAEVVQKIAEPIAAKAVEPEVQAKKAKPVKKAKAVAEDLDLEI